MITMHWKTVAALLLFSAYRISCVAQNETTTIVFSGSETFPGGVPSTGSVTLQVNGYTLTVPYGVFSSSAGIASAFGGLMSESSASPVWAKANGSTLTIKSRAYQYGFFTVSGSVQPQNGPFQVSVVPPSRLTGSFYIDCESASGSLTATCTGTIPPQATGQVSFSLNGSSWTSASVSGGVATAIGSLQGLAAGTYTVIANYSGDSNFTPESDTFDLLVSADPSVPAAFGNAIYSYAIPSNGYDGAGNITAYTDSVNGTWTAGYDQLNRLSRATVQNGSSAISYLCWNYDSFGNRLGQVVQSTSCDPNDVSGSFASAPNNQIGIAADYDAAGNLQVDGANTYLYDGAGHLCAVRRSIAGTVMMEGYIYDTEGERVAKGSISSFNCKHDPSVNGFTATQWISDGADGKAQWISTLVSSHMNIYVSGALHATADAHIAHFQLSDWLGTRRIQTDPFGLPEASFMNRPYGDSDQLFQGSNDASDIHFTGHVDDFETGLSYFGARYYNDISGVFLTPDDGSDYSPSYPQSWNLYSYARNNPLVNIDPLGRDCVYLNNKGNGAEEVDKDSNRLDCVGDGSKAHPGTGGYWVDGRATGLYYDPNTNAVALTGSDRATGFITSSEIYNVAQTTVNVSGSTDAKNIGFVNLYSFNEFPSQMHLEQIPSPRPFVGWRQFFRGLVNCAASPDPTPQLNGTAKSGGAPDSEESTPRNTQARTVGNSKKSGHVVSDQMNSPSGVNAADALGGAASIFDGIAQCMGRGK